MPTDTPATRDYQKAQVALRALTYKDVARLWALLDPEKLDDTFPKFAAATLQVIRQRRDASVAFARAYLAALRAGVEGEAPDVAAAPFPAGDALTSLRFSSVVSIKRAMTRGTPLGLASRNALVLTMGTADRIINDGGRELIRASVEADPAATGWIRVTLGTCGFCAKEAAGDHMQAGDANFPRHDHCGCVPEPQYEDALKPEEEFVQKIRGMLERGEVTEDQLRQALLDPDMKPLSRANIEEALSRVEQERADLAAQVAEAFANRTSAFTPEQLQNALDPTRNRTASAIQKELATTQEGKDLLTSIKGFTETRGGVANLRKNIEKTLAGEGSAATQSKVRAFLDAMNTYPTENVPTLFRGIAVRVEENSNAWWDAFEGQFQPGQQFSLNASSFSSSEKKAAEFSSMIGGTKKANSNYTAVRMVLEGDTSALPVQQLSKFKAEKEWITGGDFEVVGFERATPKQPYYKVTVRQIKKLGVS